MTSEKTNKPGGGLGGIWGVATGIVLTVLYIKFGFSLPAWLQPVETAKDAFISLSASLAVDENDPNELQRQIALNMKSPGHYVAIDNALDNFITEEIVWRTRLKRTVKLLQDQIKRAARDLQRYPALSESLDALPGRLLAEKKLALEYLRQRFFGMSETQIIDQLRTLPLSDVLHMDYPSARIVFSLGAERQTKVTIMDANDRSVRTLVESPLPAGQYRLYWNFTGDEGQRLSPQDTYTYEIRLDGDPYRHATLETPAAIWE